MVTKKENFFTKLYKNEIAIIKMGDIQKESRKKGCWTEVYISSLIFNAHIQQAKDTVRARTQLGIKVNE